jgi:hypothetical protein
MMEKKIDVAVGQRFSCTYPQHGVKNILCKQEGIVDKVGVNYLTIKREDGSYRSLRIEKMVNPTVDTAK